MNSNGKQIANVDLMKLRAGTPEYNRSELASAFVQKVQLIRDIQAELEM